MLRTRITEKYGLDHPIMSAPMAMHSGGGLAGAVSAAGALGSFGAINPGGPDWVRDEIRKAREITDKPIAVGFITHLLPFFGSLLDAALEEGVRAVAFSFEDPAPYVDKVKAAGGTVICQVQTIKAAREAVAAGADVLVAQGNEAGGHTGTMNLLPLLVNVVEAYPDVPVMAAGGVTNGRSLAAVLAAGADGAWMGTALLATAEAGEISEAYKQAIVDSDGEDSVYTGIMDTINVKASGIPPWPQGIAERLLPNAVVEKWRGREDALASSIDAAAEEWTEARNQGEHLVLMGQGAAQVSAVRPVADVIRSVCDDAERILRERPSALLG